MARITTEELSGGLLEAKQNAEALLRAYDKILESIRESSDILKKNQNNLNLADARDVERLNRLFSESNKLAEQRQRVDREKTKVQQEINFLTDEEVKGRIRFQKAQREQRRLLESEIILQEKQVETLKDLREENKALRIARDQLNFREDAEQIAAYNAQIDKNTEILKGNSDAQTQLKFNVGNYREEVGAAIRDNLSFSDSFGKLGIAVDFLRNNFVQAREAQKKQNEELKEGEGQSTRLGRAFRTLGRGLALSGIGAVFAGLGALVNQFRSTREGAIAFEKTISQIFTTLRVIGGFVIDFTIAKFKELSARFDNFGLRISLQIEQFKDFFSSTQETANEIQRLTNEINKNNEVIEEQGRVLQSLSDRNLSSEIGEANKAVAELIENQFKLQDATKRANIEIARQRTIEERLLTIADDDTRSFNERNEARRELLKILNSTNSATSRAANLARQELDISRDAVQLSLQERGIDAAKIKSLLAQNSLTTALINDQATLAKLDVQVFDELADAEVTFIEARQERSQQLLDTTQTLNKLIFDDVEQNVDFLIDGNDQIKTSNELLINDEAKNLETRRRILNETQALIIQSNRLVREEIARTVEGLSGADIGRAFDEAVSPQDLNNRLRELGLAEIPINRLLELFREIQTQSRDFAETSKAITQAEGEAVNLREDIEAQNRVLNDQTIENAEDLNEALEQLREDRFNNEVNQLNAALKSVEEDSLEELRIKQRLNDLLIAEEKRRLEEESEAQIKADEEAAERAKQQEEFIKKTSLAATEAVINGFIRRSEVEQNQLQESINDAQRREDELFRLSASANSQVSQLAADSLEEQRRIERQKTQELEAEKRRQIRLEAVLAGLQAFAANAGEPNAAGRTVADIGVLIAGLASAGSIFYEGTDRTLSNGKGVDSKGGFLAINHPNEMIMQENLVKQMGYPSRYEVADVFTKFKDGDLIDRRAVIPNQKLLVNNDNSDVVRELKMLRDHMSRSNSGQSEFDNIKGALKYKKRNGNRINKFIYYV